MFPYSKWWYVYPVVEAAEEAPAPEVEEPPVEVEEPPAAVEEPTPEVEEPPPEVEEPAVEEPPPVVEELPPAVEEPTPAEEGNCWFGISKLLAEHCHLTACHCGSMVYMSAQCHFSLPLCVIKVFGRTFTLSKDMGSW
ncbi:protein TonB-like [Osmerus mordax]|uniref:protein TonB-like n=1 Tax=Osmerus mordax TaxID=8014 RepID=UPI0035107B97